MDNDRIKGKIDEIKGDVKKKIGDVTGDKSLQGEGIVDKAKGKIENAFGKVKDEGRAERDRVEHSDEEDVA
jgi:uncharacterized protein YjbJ (UPF0337 family)